MSQVCPDESDLVALAEGAPVSAELRLHVESCRNCGEAVAALRSQISTLRLLLPGGVPQAQSQSAAGRNRPASGGAGSATGRPAFIGKYFIAGVLDENDQAIRYRAAHAVLYQEVVITLAKNAQVAAADRQALTSAARRLMGFAHPLVTRVVDFDFWENRPYMVEEYRHGRPLTEEGALANDSASRRIHLVRLLADALYSTRAAGLTEFDAAQLTPVVDTAGGLWLTGLSSAWLRGMTSAGSAAASANDQHGAGDVRVLAAWLSAVTAATGADATVARLCADCRNASPGAPRDSAEFLRRLQAVAPSRRRWIVAAVVLAAAILAAWALLR